MSLSSIMVARHEFNFFCAYLLTNLIIRMQPFMFFIFIVFTFSPDKTSST